MLNVQYDITFDNSLYDKVRLIHNDTLVQIGGEILKFGWTRHDNKTIKGNPWRSYTFTIALKLADISLLKKQPTASAIGASAPRNTDCFVATAAFGHKDQAEVVVLRALRDEVLSQSGIGRLIVSAYERVSPPVASVVRKNRVLAMLTRTVLRRLALPLCARIHRRATNRLTRHAADSGACQNERRCG